MRHNELTTLQSRVAILLNNRAGRANLDVKVFSPFAWDDVIQPPRPVMYPSKIMVKHSTIAG